MATSNVIQGKLFGLKVNNTFIDCQIDATINFEMSTEEGEVCKPTTLDTTDGASWSEPVGGMKSGSIDFSAKSLAKMTGFGLYELSNLMINGNNSVAWVFGTTVTSDYGLPATITYAGDGLLVSQSISAPNTGESTYDMSITMVGKPTVSRVTHTT